MKQKISFIIVGIWFLLALATALIRDGLSRDSVTTLIILAYFLLSLWWFYKKGQFIEVKDPARTFIGRCLINAMTVEILHMISKPLRQSLLITSKTSLAQALKNTSLDLILTLPAYLVIFFVIWRIVRRCRYSPFQYFFLMAFGQAVGDGGAYFFVNPGALVLVPYIMLNYWSMNFVPYLIVRKDFPCAMPRDSDWKRTMLPIVILPITYFVVGGIIAIVGRKLGWI